MLKKINNLIKKEKPERVLQKEVVSFLKSYKQVQVVVITSTKYGQRGIPDILCNASGRFVAIEIKKTNKSAITTLQRLFLLKCENNGGKAYLVTNDNFNDFKKDFDNFLISENK